MISDCQVIRAMVPQRKRPKAVMLSREGSFIYHFGVKQEFDAASFRYFVTEGCGLWENVYASDKNDVYILRPQSCGGDNCDDDYNGYYWESMGVKRPSSFVMLGGRYGRDAEHIYHLENVEDVAESDLRTFEVMWCHERESTEGEIVARDAFRYFIEGKPVPKERVEEKWGQDHPRGDPR